MPESDRKEQIKDMMRQVLNLEAERDRINAGLLDLNSKLDRLLGESSLIHDGAAVHHGSKTHDGDANGRILDYISTKGTADRRALAVMVYGNDDKGSRNNIGSRLWWLKKHGRIDKLASGKWIVKNNT